MTEKSFGGKLNAEKKEEPSTPKFLDQAKDLFLKWQTPNSGSSKWEDQSDEVQDYFIEQVVIIKQVGEKKDKPKISEEHNLEITTHFSMHMVGPGADKFNCLDVIQQFAYDEDHDITITSGSCKIYYTEKKDNGRVDKVK